VADRKKHVFVLAFELTKHMYQEKQHHLLTSIENLMKIQSQNHDFHVTNP
jgi:hypothetical protein